MAEAARQAAPQVLEMGQTAPNSSQTAQYTRELIDSLRKMAKSQKEEMLAILLEAASMEARRIAGRER
ncbi:MAG TPA: hypothetical protein VLC29_04495 [Rhizomicrobium sp.]|nr:hypothetical protein [Rhizomicrobium sp.]